MTTIDEQVEKTLEELGVRDAAGVKALTGDATWANSGSATVREMVASAGVL